MAKFTIYCEFRWFALIFLQNSQNSVNSEAFVVVFCDWLVLGLKPLSVIDSHDCPLFSVIFNKGESQRTKHEFNEKK